MNEQTFIKCEQRERLKEASCIIECVLKEITIDFEEFIPLDTSLEYLNRAINLESRFY
ncbi:hypothetical protein JOC25_000022 [Solibacillus kalamii]|uniref:hypothetical protein n=1 Tax=Solibacillus kalamii TaxID=1748298 RepID=UPI0013028ADA|nr:hypothetical protein [Solibacillus kalamii]MBM7663566.1 hypothetical protein [Solibacillus kalamii]